MLPEEFPAIVQTTKTMGENGRMCYCITCEKGEFLKVILKYIDNKSLKLQETRKRFKNNLVAKVAGIEDTKRIVLPTYGGPHKGLKFREENDLLASG